MYILRILSITLLKRDTRLTAVMAVVNGINLKIHLDFNSTLNNWDKNDNVEINCCACLKLKLLDLIVDKTELNTNCLGGIN